VHNVAVSKKKHVPAPPLQSSDGCLTDGRGFLELLLSFRSSASVSVAAPEHQYHGAVGATSTQSFPKT